MNARLCLTMILNASAGDVDWLECESTMNTDDKTDEQVPWQ